MTPAARLRAAPASHAHNALGSIRLHKQSATHNMRRLMLMWMSQMPAAAQQLHNRRTQYRHGLEKKLRLRARRGHLACAEGSAEPDQAHTTRARAMRSATWAAAQLPPHRRRRRRGRASCATGTRAGL